MSRIGPTSVVVVDTGVVRFLVSPQKTHAVYSVLLLQVVSDRSLSLSDCYFARRQSVYLRSLPLSYSFFLPDSTPTFCLLSYPGIGVGVPGYEI